MLEQSKGLSSHRSKPRESFNLRQGVKPQDSNVLNSLCLEWTRHRRWLNDSLEDIIMTHMLIIGCCATAKVMPSFRVVVERHGVIVYAQKQSCFQFWNTLFWGWQSYPKYIVMPEILARHAEGEEGISPSELSPLHAKVPGLCNNS